jgi:hypothetical protein
MPTSTHQPIRLVTTVREQYLRKEENRIRSEAVSLSQSDPLVSTHLIAVQSSEELHEIHEAAAIRQDRMGAEGIANVHRRLAATAWQLKLHHLHQLAGILL